MIFLTFFLGMICNILGYIPPGNINLTVVKITINRGMKQALYFIGAFSVVEFFFTFGVMRFAQWLSLTVNLDVIIDWVMVLLFGTLGFITWKHRNKTPDPNYSNQDSIKYGLLLGVVNPMQIPFWMITGTYLISHEWISTGWFVLTVFSFGSAVGSFLILFAFAKFAGYITAKFTLSNSVINKSIARLFFALAAYHVFKQLYLAFLK